jgi:hypothetical protein
MKEHDTNIKNRYKPDPKIKDYIRERIELNQKLKEKTRSQFSNKEQNFEDKVRQDKKRLLDNIIFPSMANLVVFFEALATNSEVRELFEDDIKELFGYIREPRDENKEDENSYNVRLYIIRRLIDSLLTWDVEKDPDNFRLDLISGLQQIIFYQFTSITRNIIDQKRQTIVSKTVESDMRRALSWTEFLQSRYIDDSSKWGVDSNKTPSRPVRF